MIIAICGDCGWLGGPPDLVMIKGVSEELTKNLSPLMAGNRDASYLSCPSCSKLQIFYKNLQGGEVPKPSFVNDIQVASVSNIEPTVEISKTTTIQPPSTTQAIAVAEELDHTVPPRPDEFIPPPEVDSRGHALKPGTAPVVDKGHVAAEYKCYCDECGNDFKTKIERSTRCDKCLRKLTGRRG